MLKGEIISYVTDFSVLCKSVESTMELILVCMCMRERERVGERESIMELILMCVVCE